MPDPVPISRGRPPLRRAVAELSAALARWIGRSELTFGDLLVAIGIILASAGLALWFGLPAALIGAGLALALVGFFGGW